MTPILAQVTYEISSVWIFWAAVISLLAGILILIFPRVLNYIVAIYLIVAGILGLAPYVSQWLGRG